MLTYGITDKMVTEHIKGWKSFKRPRKILEKYAVREMVRSICSKTPCA